VSPEEPEDAEDPEDPEDAEDSSESESSSTCFFLLGLATGLDWEDRLESTERLDLTDPADVSSTGS
jgi:hypothetical protein